MNGDVLASELWWITKENPSIKFKVNGKEFTGRVVNIGEKDRVTIDCENLPAGEIDIDIIVPKGIINPNNVMID